MAAPADGPTSLRDLAERLALAAAGAAALTAERVEELAGDGLGGRPLSSVFRELGLVTRDELDELELRLAQLEHRLRLLESPPG